MIRPSRHSPASSWALTLVFALGATPVASARDDTAPAPSRFAVRDAHVQEQTPPSRFTVNAALRPSDLPETTTGPRLRLKARLGGDALDTTCGAADGLFANGFE